MQATGIVSIDSTSIILRSLLDLVRMDMQKQLLLNVALEMR